MMINGTSGDDNLTGTSGDDTFDLSQGGHDTAFSGNGYDIFNIGSTLDANDKLNGGNQFDILRLDGDYSAGLVLKAHTIQNIEQIDLAAGHNYNLTFDDANIDPLNPAASSFTLSAAALGAADQAILDASAERDTHLYIYGGAGDDVISGGQFGNNFILTQGGNDTVTGGGGQDSFFMGGTLTAADRIDGHGGSDEFDLSGDYSTQLVLAASTVKNLNNWVLEAGFTYNIKISDGTFAAGVFASINGDSIDAAHRLIFDGSKETDADLQVD
jgi:Ca2+-binding RTX toxin-like protein